jgi:hypothetical protein
MDVNNCAQNRKPDHFFDPDPDPDPDSDPDEGN